MVQRPIFTDYVSLIMQLFEQFTPQGVDKQGVTHAKILTHSNLCSSSSSCWRGFAASLASKRNGGGSPFTQKCCKCSVVCHRLPQGKNHRLGVT